MIVYFIVPIERIIYLNFSARYNSYFLLPEKVQITNAFPKGW